MYSTDEVAGRLITYAKRNYIKNQSVFFACPIIIPQIIWAVYTEPVSLLLASVPLIYTIPIFITLDRVEPEPRVAKIYAFSYGAIVATSIALIINGIVDSVLGSKSSIVLSAPIAEEGLKFLGLLWAYRKRLIGGPLDGVVYAALIALGFASVENIFYFSTAASEGVLGTTFILRGILSPFAHPLFTMWTGIFLGKAIQKHKRISNHAVMGLSLSVALHGLWNTSAVLGNLAAILILLIAPFFVFVFDYSILYIYRLRKAEETSFQFNAKLVAQHFEISPEKAEIYGFFADSMKLRKKLNRKQKKVFDQQRTAFSQLVSMFSNPATIRQNEVDELINQINSIS